MNPHESANPASAPQTLESALGRALEEAGHLLPDQAPIRVFIHHNTLHAFQHLHFHAAVRRAHEVYGAEPYLSEERFREALQKGRIRAEDIDAALHDQYPDAGDAPLIADLTLHGLRRLLMLHPQCGADRAQVLWLLSEGKLTRALRSDLDTEARLALLEDSGGDEQAAASALWEACLSAVDTAEPTAPPLRTRTLLHRDVLLAETGEDCFDLVFPALIRLAAAYLDDGVASWTMPGRERGFYNAVRDLADTDRTGAGPFIAAARRAFQAQRDASLEPEAVVVSILRALGVRAEEVEAYVTTLLLTLPGWAGIMSRLERHPEDRGEDAPRASLLAFLAVRLTYEHAALQVLATRHGLSEGDLGALYRKAMQESAAPVRVEREVRAYPLFQLAQLAGLSARRLTESTIAERSRLWQALGAFDALARRRVFQEAYEHHHGVEVLAALAAQRPFAKPSAGTPRFQLVCCFDDREESFRRHVEEVAPDCETYGAPGFFGAAIRFRGIDEVQHVPLAPVVIKPTHLVEERPHAGHHALSDLRRARRRGFARLSAQLQRGTRSLWRGILLNAGFGMLALFPLLARLLSPRLAGRLRSWLAERFLPTPRTELTVHHDEGAELPRGVLQRGFKLDERVIRVATVLENIGLTDRFAELVVVLGHGSTTLNNPHKSAYDCGACGGRQGGPNARVFCQMANDPVVRAGLRARGIVIPDATFFVGGQHDTCEDEVLLFDLERCPEGHRRALSELIRVLDEARGRNAQERCRRLMSAPKNPSRVQALRHVEARSEHLAEPRPEFGHATVAVAVVGRRMLTRGLFLDRRAFLISYDPTIDETGAILERSLAAAAPVGAGINLEYYFSHVDNERYGAGSKLPHNVTGLFGVMSGHASDLRTGLPRQMIEIHEPVRLLVIVEATCERLLDIASRNPEVRELVVHRWIRLVSLDPATGAMHVFTDRGFVPFSPPPTVLREGANSRDIFVGHDDLLPPARIVALGRVA